MITQRQIRAARALLGWDAADLAEKAGLTRATLSNIENGLVQARAGTLEKIENVFIEAGIEFLPGEGIRPKDRMVAIIEGESAYQNLLDDIYNTLRDTGGEVLIAFVDETKGMQVSSKEFLQKHLERLQEANITERLIVRQGDKNLIAPMVAYHSIPEQYFSPHQFYIYGSKLAHLARLSPPKAIIIEDERFSGSLKKLFNFVWDMTALPLQTKD